MTIIEDKIAFIKEHGVREDFVLRNLDQNSNQVAWDARIMVFIPTMQILQFEEGEEFTGLESMIKSTPGTPEPPFNETFRIIEVNLEKDHVLLQRIDLN